MKKDSRPNEPSSGLSGHRGRSIPVAMLLILVVLISAGSGVYAGASFFAQQGPGVTVTTTLFTTTTSWTTSTIWSTVTEVVQGVLTNIEYTTSTSTVTVTGSTSYRTAKIITANGNAQISTTQSKFGGASGLFHGSGDYVSTPDSADWQFGAGAFTVDFWIRTSAKTHQQIITYGKAPEAHVNWGWAFELYTDNKIHFLVDDGNTWRVNIVSATSVNNGEWHHIAGVRSGNNFMLFIDGVQEGGTTTWSGTINWASGFALRIGSSPFNNRYVNGWLDEFRVSKGVARWTSSFTPPTNPYTGDSNTVLLLHMDGTDGSTTFIDDVTG